MSKIKSEMYPSFPERDIDYYMKFVKKAKKYKWHVLVTENLREDPPQYRKVCSGTIIKILPQSFLVSSPTTEIVVQFHNLINESMRIEVI